VKSIVPEQDPGERRELIESAVGLASLQRELVALLDEMINSYLAPDAGDEVHEHLEVLRVLLKSQVAAYLEYIVERNTLSATTSPMYEGEVALQQPLKTSLRSLTEGGTLTPGQAARLADYVSERRTMLVFGDRATGKSTLLNSLIELVSVDERFVSIEHTDHLPALKDRSFCVRLSVNDDTDLDSLFAKALKMQPSRIVIGEIHGDEILFLLNALKKSTGVGGFCTLRADSVHKAVARVVRQMQLHLNAADSKRLVGETRPVLVHMRSDEQGAPRLAAIWSVEGADANGEIVLSEQATQD
jgi:Flp pilus assembly CpaF family ATPase